MDTIEKTATLTRTATLEVFQMFGPLFTDRFITKVEGRVAAVITVLNPHYTRENSHHPTVLEDLVLGEKDASEWPHRYNEYAMAKAEAAWRSARSNHLMFAGAPHLIEANDFKFAGGVYDDGLVVATSGLKCWEDDLFVSQVIASAIKAHVIKAANVVLNEPKKEKLFFQ